MRIHSVQSETSSKADSLFGIKVIIQIMCNVPIFDNGHLRDVGRSKVFYFDGSCETKGNRRKID